MNPTPTEVSLPASLLPAFPGAGHMRIKYKLFNRKTRRNRGGPVPAIIVGLLGLRQLLEKAN